MAEPFNARLQTMLKAAVQTVHWTYCLFWQLCPQQRVLVWGDGYYNGAIKTRKTVQPTEVAAEEAALQRSQQLRELYEALSAGEGSHHQPRRPSASLSPEDLTESEWFYLMCVSFSFPLGVGLPGKAYVDRHHIWLTKATEADSKVFSRAILAKSARIQTVLCIPLLNGVVELGTTERIQEDIELIQRVKSFFTDCENSNPNPRPALTEHSTSNPPTASSTPPLSSPALAALPPPPPLEDCHVVAEEEEEVESESNSEPHQNTVLSATNEAAATEPMQLDVSDQDIRLSSPDDCSNNLNSDVHLLAVSRPSKSPENRWNGSLERAGSTRRWPLKDPVNIKLQPPHSSDAGGVAAEEDTHYSQTVLNILQNQHNPLSKYSSSTSVSTATSAFSGWSSTPSRATNRHKFHLDKYSSQWALKYILFTVPLLHTKLRDPTARRGTPSDDLNGNHMLAERRRREKLNERFVVLRSMVPFVTKMDKASILGDTIEYLKQMRKRIQELESQPHCTEAEKKRRRVAADGGGWKPKNVESLVGKAEAQVEVSIIENDALVEIQCLHKEGLLLDVMQLLGELGIQMITVQSSINNGIFAAELRAKVMENVKGRKPSIVEVKRTINRIILQQ